MNKNNRFVRIVIAVLLAAVMAGASAQTLLSAMEIPCGMMNAYAPALIVAVLCGLGSASGAMTIVAYIAAAALGGMAVVMNLDAVAAVRIWIASLTNPEVVPDAAVLARAGFALSVCLGALLSACLYACVSRPGSTPMALLIYFAILIGSYAMAESLSFGMAVPGLLAAMTAFVLSGEVPRDAGAWRALIPVTLIVGIALCTVPAGRLTWEPLEKAAQTVRAVFEDYFNFTHERIPFTINTEGYNHAAEIAGEVITQLGGPADPTEEPMMTVTSDADVLLRGSIRRTYTGHSWEDPDAKARYLYYDFTRSGVREDVFCMKNNEAFAPVSVSVEFMRTGASSLFVPARLKDFSMDLQNALYYNSVGEIFLSRQVQEGDRYSLSGYRTADEMKLRQAVIEAQSQRDGDFDEMLASNSQMPDGVEPGVYALTVELTQNAENAYDKAAAIMSWLRGNCVYTLEPDYPAYDRDFVSQFVLDTREGYCSYFASAMTVMCRIAGLPARYVEGYSIDAGENVTVTGEDAHAWTEVYFNGIGWVPFDASNGSGGSGDGLDDGDTADDEEVQATPSPEPTPTPTPEPEDEPDDATPPPEHPEENSTPEPEATPTPDPGLLPPDRGQKDEPEKERNLGWLWTLMVILLILILLALLVLWVKSRLDKTNPVRLSAKAKTVRQASMILYRSCLTLLAQMGLSPLSGETPGAFARRVGAQTGNEAFVAFSDQVAMMAYSRSGTSRETVEIGRRAYAAFEKGMKRGEKMRFFATRLFKGLGEFESIP